MLHGIILAAGEGRRQKALTDMLRDRHARPKALLPVGNNPLVKYGIDQLAALGLQRVYVGIGPRAESELLEKHLTDPKLYGIEVMVHSEAKRTDTAGLVRYFAEHAINNLNRDDVLCILPCDTPNLIDLQPIYEAHLKHGSSVTAAALPIRWSSSEWQERTFGTIQIAPFPIVSDYPDRNMFEADAAKIARNLHGGSYRVSGFHEKQKRDTAPSNLINTGIYFFNAGFIMDIAPFLTPLNATERFSDFGLHILPLLAGRWDEFAGHKALAPLIFRAQAGEFSFYAYLLSPDTYWRDVSNPLALLKSNMDLLDGKLTNNIDPQGKFWHRRPWGWQGNWGVSISPTANIALPVGPGTFGSLIGSHVLVEDGARIERSVVLDYADIAGSVVNSIVFPGSTHHMIGDNVTLRRSQVARGTELINCIYVSGTIPVGARIRDKIIYENIYGGTALDPL